MAAGRLRAAVQDHVRLLLQYRASIFIWMISHVLEPLIYLVVWSVVSRSMKAAWRHQHGQFAAYFIVMMLVNHMTYTWIIYEYEYRIREGTLSFALLRPLHPDPRGHRGQCVLQIDHSAHHVRCRRPPRSAVQAGVSVQPLGRSRRFSRAPVCVHSAFPCRMDARPRRLLDHACQCGEPGVLRCGAVSFRPGGAVVAPPLPRPGGGGGAAVPLDDQLSGGDPPWKAHSDGGITGLAAQAAWLGMASCSSGWCGVRESASYSAVGA